MSDEIAPPATRSYNSSLRAGQAAETRRRILEAAAECFSATGYGGTSLADIARAAGVSVETVKLNGPKRDLLLAAFEQSFAGREGRDSLADHEPIAAITETADDADYLRGIVHFVAEANRRSSRLWAAFLAAASSDSVVAEELAALQQRRRADFHTLVAVLTERGMVAASVPPARLAEALSFLVSPESYGQLVRESGWSQADYEAWLARTITLLAREGWPA
ncbi:TetR/AcrR family transcriptional regulator [Microterricola viridarii]|uniref:DNA-binding transcriptional regulator, AcrR family n=1 Tax=Microterricola viridarii TaxID=412690 RepID=A0A1H1N2I5_9MICO|nr:TetR/AcrR family transcriptional regulator [Microterricola viridarii]SDR92399.1 DNA-binding transcriptional regulator, AcrR family [Microterricola viridarii]